MKINHLQADNFLRLNLFDVNLDDAVVHLFAGGNEVGKSSVQEAIRFALKGETVRVSKKGDFKLMIRDGAKSGSVGVRIDGIDIVRDIKTAKETSSTHSEQLPPFLPFVIDSQHFAHMNQDKRRAFLIDLTGTKVVGSDISRRMTAKGVDEKCIEMVLPMLRSGLTATHKEAQSRASEARSKWVGLTGNARYGSQIAADWVAVPPEDFDEARLKELLTESDEFKRQLSDLHTDRGSTNSQIDMAKDKHPCKCCECGALLKITTDRDHATGKIKQASEPFDESGDVDIGKLQSRLIDISNDIAKTNTKLMATDAEIRALQAKEVLFKQSEEITDRAQEMHRNVQMWEKAVETLAPDGIPAEILSDTLKPVNDRLRNTANITGWSQVTVDPTMEIVVDSRRYSLLSESARWRADVAIADAISYLSGLGVMVIDRMDVLDLVGRAQFMGWINQVKEEYDTILIFATLKAKPQLPAGMKAHWIQNGEILETTNQEDAA